MPVQAMKEQSNDAAHKPSDDKTGPSLAAIEAGEAQIEDHLAYFTAKFADVQRPSAGIRLSPEDFQTLYRRNQHSHGRHFVIHQHDHPVAGTFCVI